VGDHNSFILFSAAETYNHTDSEFLKADSTQTRDAGSTASTAIIVGDRLIVANVGDSRAVISKGGEGRFVVSNIFHYTSMHLCILFSIRNFSFLGHVFLISRMDNPYYRIPS
jgi:hypothetical protein